MVFSVNIQKRFADSDILGHINNVNLQHYFDVGKSSYFQDVAGIGLVWKKLGLITAATNTNYMAQTRYEESVAVETQMEKVGDKSITLLQRVVNSDNGEVKAESRTVLVAFDFETQESIEIPQQWRRSFEDSMA